MKDLDYSDQKGMEYVSPELRAICYEVLERCTWEPPEYEKVRDQISELLDSEALDKHLAYEVKGKVDELDCISWRHGFYLGFKTAYRVLSDLR